MHKLEKMDQDLEYGIAMCWRATREYETRERVFTVQPQQRTLCHLEGHLVFVRWIVAT